MIYSKRHPKSFPVIEMAKKDMSTLLPTSVDGGYFYAPYIPVFVNGTKAFSIEIWISSSRFHATT